MHDPDTLAFRVRLPIPFGKQRRKDYSGGWFEIAEIWHHDPCSDHSDDSCGWFIRARHGDKHTLKKIIHAFQFEWTNAYQPWFHGNGDPALSTIGIVVQMFQVAAFHHFNGSRRRTEKFMRRYLFQIIAFAENSTDTMATSIQGRWGEAQQPADERAAEAARIIYPFVLRLTRPWWKHPRFHVHHWRIYFPIARWLRHRILSRENNAATSKPHPESHV